MSAEKEQLDPSTSSLLIVDDHETNRFVLKKILASLKLNVLEAESGKVAIEQVKSNKVFLILMDINMPEMDGLEAATKIREEKEYETIPIIFITGQYKENLSIQSGYETGAVDYLVKPVDPKALISKVKVFYELQQKTEALEVSNKQMKKFAHTVAHDLKNPLSTMVASMDLLLMDGVVGKESEEIIFMHQKTGYRLLKMIDELLKTATSVSEMSMESVDLSEVLDHVLEDLNLQIKRKQAVVEIDELPSIKGSEAHLYQIFQNLISNALKYSRPNIPPHIQVKVNLLETPEPRVGIEVIDNGLGFDEDQSENLFKPFRRLTNEGEGRGIGLFTVREVVESHGGQISAKSVKGEGSAFSLELPIHGKDT